MTTTTTPEEPRPTRVHAKVNVGEYVAATRKAAVNAAYEARVREYGDSFEDPDA